MVRNLSFGLMALAVTVHPGFIQSRAAAADLDFEPYTFTAQSGEVVQAEMGTLSVAYDRGGEDSSTIDLKYVRFPATTDNPGPPLVYLAGGPGGSGINAAMGPRFELFMKLRELGDVIAWDQRGTGLSEPSVPIDVMIEIPIKGVMSTNEVMKKVTHYAGQVRAQFDREGFDPDPLNTNASADDLEDLRVALGVEKLRLWAISYGSHLALATVKRHPDSIDSMVLAGVEGLDSTYKLPSQAEAPIEALSREIAAHPVYGPLIPDFGQLLREVFEQAEREPYPVEVQDPETGQTVTARIGRLELETATWGMLFRRDLMSFLPSGFLSIRMGRTEMLAQIAQRTRGRSGLGTAMSLAMDCASGVSAERLDRVQRETPDSLFGRSMNVRTQAVCSGLGIPDLGDSFRAPVKSDMPILCISGEMDVRTPPSNAEKVLEGFPNGQHVIITRAGHDNDLWVSSPKIAKCIIAFFNGQPIPYQRIELPPIEFMVPPGFGDQE